MWQGATQNRIQEEMAKLRSMALWRAEIHLGRAYFV